ncbi:MAG: hypothetical protein LJE70_15935 [Chromatiaceae bacterium]|jgi:hypothetical protein|nr:hypothetical protein [Chromatiaceae bacterium]
MYPRFRIATNLTAALSVASSIFLFQGCVSQPAAVDYYMRTKYQISGSDSYVVRPALDVLVLGPGQGCRSATYHGSDLWGRLRSGMGLNIAHNPRTNGEVRQLEANPSTSVTGPSPSPARF